VRSTSKAADGLYRYDAILRLHDVQVRQAGLQTGAGDRLRDPADPTDYCTYGALGQAFTEPQWPAVVLIDEIDKADLDFPNDLLAVLEAPWEFEIPETGQIDERKVTAAHPPFVIITSNKEKGNLPAPFLRRCVYYWLAFPDAARLQEIVARHYEHHQMPAPSDDLRDAAIARFEAVRETRLHKPPGASEFLDWLRALQHFGDAPFPVEQLRDPDAALPYPELLFKLRADWPRSAQTA
jgi:MoxR-like ATPase